MSTGKQLSEEELIELEDKYFAQMIRFCAACQENDEQDMEKASEILDDIWKQVGNEFKPKWRQAALWIAKCVEEWPKKGPGNLDQDTQDRTDIFKQA